MRKHCVLCLIFIVAVGVSVNRGDGAEGSSEKQFKGKCEFLTISPDGSRVGMSLKRDGVTGNLIFIDGTEYGPYGETGAVSFSPDGSKAVFYYWDGHRHQWINGVSYGPNRTVSNPVFARFGSSVGFTYNRQGRWHVWIDGTEYGGKRFVRGPYFSDDASRKCFAYEAPSGGWFAWFDGKEYGPYESIQSVGVSGDGSTAFFTYKREGGWHVWKNGETVGETGYPADRYEISHNGKHIGIIHNKNQKQYLWVSGKNHGPFEEMESYAVASGGIGTMFSYRDKGKWLVNSGGKIMGTFGLHPSVYLSPSGNRYGVRHKKGKSLFYEIDGASYGPFSEADTLLFSNDESRAYFWFKKGKAEYCWFEKKTYGPFERASCTVTSDNKLRIARIKKNTVAIEEHK